MDTHTVRTHMMDVISRSLRDHYLHPINFSISSPHVDDSLVILHLNFFRITVVDLPPHSFFVSFIHLFD